MASSRDTTMNSETTISSQEELTLKTQIEDGHLGGMREFHVSENLTLSPLDLTSPVDGVLQHVKRNLLKYVETFKGVVLSVNLLKVDTSPKILDSGYVLVQIWARYYVFSPHEGDTLRGVVTKVGEDKLACLVYNCFNASVDMVGDVELTPGEIVEFIIRAVSRTKDGILAVMGVMKVASKKKDHKHKKKEHS
ncbi:DNA-directed RNA polymerase I subunit RPA43 [Oopsacas minuta]|uniref:DNA-directed RNA polymerase I subunit RPA43 n=1 Tax=Oopsacas minuta TaxID=111878 RepID=A0AAV7JFG3_9METZ|nr:DNA-directed RNA polymerase I subunit RPA43 [Oopsacas minuta]